MQWQQSITAPLFWRLPSVQSGFTIGIASRLPRAAKDPPPHWSWQSGKKRVPTGRRPNNSVPDGAFASSNLASHVYTTEISSARPINCQRKLSLLS